MPDLDFQVLGVEAANRGLVPLLHFRLQITGGPAPIHAIILQVQIQIQSPRRRYNAGERERLVEIFGTPDQWGQTLRNKLWTHAQVSVPAFTGSTTVILPVPCTYDLNVAATKYFYAIEEGEIPLLFLFSGTIFYCAAEGNLQVERISWEKESEYRMPASVWHEMMEQHYPNTAWITLRRDVFERLYAYKRQHGCISWEEALERLLTTTADEEAALTTP